jgi:tetratricopeptide (TPR) repeat protein
LNENLAEAHCTLGMLKSWYDADWAGAGEAFQRALTADANSITALIWHALHLSAIGQPQDALRSIKRARELDPLSVIVNTYLGVVHFVLGQYDLAVRQLKQTIELDPYYYRSYLFLGKSLAALGRPGEATDLYREALERNPGSLEALTCLACELAIIGQRDSALELLEKVRATEDHFEPSLLCAAICCALGDANGAFRWLDRALQNRAGPLYLVRIDDMFHSLRRDPRYRRFLDRIGLAAAA